MRAFFDIEEHARLAPGAGRPSHFDEARRLFTENGATPQAARVAEGMVAPGRHGSRQS